MNWIDIASIVFVCVTANHLGLVKAIEAISKKGIPIINCPKCASFWFILVYMATVSEASAPSILAISFLASYSALWLELLEGYIDTLYLKLYDKIYRTKDDTPTSDADSDYPPGAVSQL